MAHVVVAPDSFGGTLDPVAAAEAVATGWRDARPDDDVRTVPMSDGGEGLLAAVEATLVARGRNPRRIAVEVADARGLASTADLLLLDDDTALVESALACGLAAVAPEHRDPRGATTWGVGQLVAAAARAGVRRVLVGLGGTATVDGGAGALSGLGMRLTVADGSGLKVGGHDLARVAGIRRGWIDPAVDGLEQVLLLADVRAPLADAAAVYGPQKGADLAAVAHLTAALARWADVAERSLGRPGLRHEPGTGAAGGLGFGLAAALGARLVPGAEAVAALVGLEPVATAADVVVTGEGRIDATSFEGKVVGTVAALAGDRPVLAVSGLEPAEVGELARVEVAAADGPSPDPAGDVRRAAARLAEGWSP